MNWEHIPAGRRRRNNQIIVKKTNITLVIAVLLDCIFRYQRIFWCVVLAFISSRHTYEYVNIATTTQFIGEENIISDTSDIAP